MVEKRLISAVMKMCVDIFNHIFVRGVGDAAWWSQHGTVTEDMVGGLCIFTHRVFVFGQSHSVKIDFKNAHGQSEIGWTHALRGALQRVPEAWEGLELEGVSECALRFSPQKTVDNRAEFSGARCTCKSSWSRWLGFCALRYCRWRFFK